MAEKVMEKILEIQGYSVQNITRKASKIIIDLEKDHPVYTCSRCGLTSFFTMTGAKSL